VLTVYIGAVGKSAAGSFRQCTNRYEQQQQSFRQIHRTDVRQ